jgi:hypothetical protein
VRRPSLALDQIIHIVFEPYYAEGLSEERCFLWGNADIRLQPGRPLEERIDDLFHGQFRPLAEVAKIYAPGWW